MLQAKQQLRHDTEREAQMSNLTQSLCQYSTTTQSETLFSQKASFFSGTSSEQQSLKKIFEELDLADLVSIQVQDFIPLLELCQINTEKKRQLKAEITFQQMITLNQRNLLDDSQLLAFFKTLESSDIT